MFGPKERPMICDSETIAHGSRGGRSIEEKRASIESLDLVSVRRRLVKDACGKIGEKAAEKAELRYRRFLILQLIKPESLKPIPTEDIDQFWHQHILDTKKYAQDCMETLGFFLHHTPNAGNQSLEKKKIQQKALENTAQLYENEFRDQYLPDQGRDNPVARCSTDCGSLCHD